MKAVLTPRWIAGHLLALTLISVFIYAGIWQIDRHVWRAAENELLETRRALEPVPLADNRDAPDLEFRAVTVSGTYEPEGELLRRSRSHQGQAGWHVLTPLRLADGQALLVNRGWVPYDMNTAPVSDALPPEGPVELAGVLHPGESEPDGFWSGLVPHDPPEGHLNAAYYVNLPRLTQQVPDLLQDWYLQLGSQIPAQTAELPVAVPEPELDGGPHLGYVIQWFSFALLSIISYFFLMRKVIDDEKKEDRQPA